MGAGNRKGLGVIVLGIFIDASLQKGIQLLPKKSEGLRFEGFCSKNLTYIKLLVYKLLVISTTCSQQWKCRYVFLTLFLINQLFFYPYSRKSPVL